MKSLTKHIAEKLIINKDYKSFVSNDDFYEEFSAELNGGSYLDWMYASSLKNIIPIGTKNKYIKKIIETFSNNKERVLYTRVTTLSDNYTINGYKKMIKFIKNSDIEFILNEYDNYAMYGVYIFKTGNMILCIIGPDEIDKAAPNFMYTSKATFIQQKI